MSSLNIIVLGINNVSHQNYKHFMAQYSWLWLELLRNSVLNASTNICIYLVNI